MYWLDEKILAFCTKFAHQVQWLTGRTNFFIAKIGIGITALAVLIDIANYFQQFLYAKTDVVTLIMFGLYPVFLVFKSHECDKADTAVSNSERALPKVSPMACESPAWRLFFVALSIFSLAHFSGSFAVMTYPLLEALSRCFALGIVVHDYFIMVVPLPPGTSKIREWLGKFKFTPAPEPARVRVRD